MAIVLCRSIRRVYEQKGFLRWLFEKIGAKACNACVLICACLLGSVVELPRFMWYFWKCGGDVEIYFLAYQVGINAVYLFPISDRKN